MRDKLVATGGFDGSSNINSVEIFNPASSEWILPGWSLDQTGNETFNNNLEFRLISDTKFQL